MPYISPFQNQQSEEQRGIGGTALDLLDYLNRPTYAISGAITALQEGSPEKALSRAWKGVKGEEKRTWSDILGNIGKKTGIEFLREPSIGRTALSIPLDILTDPLTYVGVGSLSKAGKMGKMLGKGGKLGVATAAARATRFKRLGKLLGAGREIGEYGLGKVAKSGVGRELATTLAKGGKVAPFGETLAQQAALGQRSLISLFGGRMPIVKGKKALGAIGRTVERVAGTGFGKTVKGIFKETTGNRQLDDVVLGPGGTKDLQQLYQRKYHDLGLPIVENFKKLTNGMGPEDVQHVKNFLNATIEPVGKEALKAAKALGPDAEFAAIMQGYGKAARALPDHLLKYEPELKQIRKLFNEASESIGLAEIKHGLPLYTRDFYVPHFFTDEFRASMKDNPALMQKVRTYMQKGYHGNLEALMLTGKGNIPEINAMQLAGEFGDEAKALGEAGIKLLEDDIPKLFIKRANLSASAIAGKELEKGVKVLADSITTPSRFFKGKGLQPGKSLLVLPSDGGLYSYDELAMDVLGKTGGKQAMGTGAKFLTVDKELAEAVLKHRDIISNPDSMQEAANAALKAYDTMHSWLRRWTLGIFPGWMARNAIGNFNLQWYAGMNPADMARYTGKVGAIQYAMLNKADDVVEVAGRRMLQSKLINEASRYGVWEHGWYGQALKELAEEQGIKQPSKYNLPGRLLKSGFAANSSVENNARLGLWWWALDKGMEPKEAATMVKKYLFDYGSLSKTEQNVFKRIAFFYTWMRKNLPIQLETYLTQPGKIVPLAAAQREFMKGQGIEGPELPEWAQRQMPFPISRDGDVVKSLVMGSYFPFGDLQEAVQEPAKKLAGAVSPLIRTPIEAEVLNRSLYFDRPITEYPGQTKEFIGTRVPAKAEYYLRGFRPFATVSRFTGSKESSSAGMSTELMRYITGTRTYRFDLQREQARKSSNYQGMTRKMKAMMKFHRRRGNVATAKDIENALRNMGEPVD